MFNLFGKKQSKTHEIGSPVKGKTIPMEEVNDPTFSGGILGKGVAVIPENGEIYAPAKGTVGLVFETLHAVSILTDYGAEILIHVGIDTVRLKGTYFEGFVKAGDAVKKGDLLLKVDIERAKAAGYDMTTPMLICNTSEYASVTAQAGKTVEAGEGILVVQEK